MGQIVEKALQAVGPLDHPYSGRCTLRVFPFGDVEALYCSAPGPSAAERVNAHLKDDGIDNAVTSRQLAGNPPAWTRAPAESPVPDPETNAERSGRRARQRCRWLLKAIGADRMLTLTWRENITDPSKAKEQLKTFVRFCRERYPEWRYCGVPEKQERGAYHWHIGVRGFYDVNVLRGLWWRALGHRVRFEGTRPFVLLSTGEWSSAPGVESRGTVNLRLPKVRGRKARTWTPDRMAAYMAKYISKAIEGGVEGLASYSASRGITWTAERYAIRALTYDNVVSGFLAIVAGAGVASPFLWSSENQKVIWAAGSSG